MPPVWKLNPAQVLALASLGVALGFWLKRRLPLLDRLDIPVPIVGGTVYALLTLALHGRVVNLEVDTTLRDLLMIAFMTTIGLNARLELIRNGGVGVIKLLAIATLGAALQNVLGILLATALHVIGTVAAAGGVAGGVVGALVESGVSKDDADIYAEAIRRGGALVVARVPDADAPRYQSVLARSAVDVTSRGTAYKKSGWTRFDDRAKPYTPDEVRKERGLYM